MKNSYKNIILKFFAKRLTWDGFTAFFMEKAVKRAKGSTDGKLSPLPMDVRRIKRLANGPAFKVSLYEGGERIGERVKGGGRGLRGIGH